MQTHPFDTHASATSRMIRGLLLVAMIGLLAACGRSVTSTPGDAPNLEKWVAEVKSRPAPPLDPLPVMQQFETFEYAAQSLARSLQQCLQRPERRQRPAPGSEPAASRRWNSFRSTAWTWSARSAAAPAWWRW